MISLESSVQRVPGKPQQENVQAPPGNYQANALHEQGPIDNEEGGLKNPIERPRLEGTHQPLAKEIVAHHPREGQQSRVPPHRDHGRAFQILFDVVLEFRGRR